VAECFGGDAGTIGDEEHGAVGGRHRVRWQIGHDLDEMEQRKSEYCAQQNPVAHCKMSPN
jgi:hypothetical protein